MTATVTPQRIRLSRTAGWRLPAGAVNVARPGQWGNPYRFTWCCQTGCATPRPKHWHVVVRYDGDDRRLGTYPTEDAARDEAIRLYRVWITDLSPEFLDAARAALAGKDLACWCPPDKRCHADVLLELVNGADLASPADTVPDAKPLPARTVDAWRLSIEHATVQLGAFNWPWALGLALDEIDRLAAQLAKVQTLVDHAKAISTSDRMTVYVGDLEHAMGQRTERARTITGTNGG